MGGDAWEMRNIVDIMYYSDGLWSSPGGRGCGCGCGCTKVWSCIEFSFGFLLASSQSSYLHSSVDRESSIIEFVTDLSGQKLLDLRKTLGTFMIYGCNSGFLCIITCIGSLLSKYVNIVIKVISLVILEKHMTFNKFKSIKCRLLTLDLISDNLTVSFNFSSLHLRGNSPSRLSDLWQFLEVWMCRRIKGSIAFATSSSIMWTSSALSSRPIEDAKAVESILIQHVIMSSRIFGVTPDWPDPDQFH